MEKKNVIQDKSFEFAVQIVESYQFLAATKREFVLSKQLLRSGTSIGANVSEAEGAISKADFSNKISIAYKECLETKYWIKLLNRTGFLDKKDHSKLYPDADEIGKILFAILRTTRIKPSHNDQ
ncbi:MAG: four helix bundle protein [Bacteroidetes bacterium]|nr:four helix bundle protein [Bacteroidota bacterium]MCL5034390.1 four helix bundle protein [Bacteroidota bacterium]MCL5268726.1 four helix bundle protein [Bacteroidota bacterium]